MLLLAAATAAARCSANSTGAPKTTFTSEYHIWVLTLVPDVEKAPGSIVPRPQASETLDSHSQPVRNTERHLKPAELLSLVVPRMRPPHDQVESTFQHQGG